MKGKVKPIPKGYHTITPYLLKGVAKHIEFLKRAFDAKVIDRMDGPKGAVLHASLQIGDSRIMLGEAHGKWKPMPTMILSVCKKNADATYRQALRAGGKSIMKPADQFWGDRHGGVGDRWGNQWWMSTHMEDVSRAETKRRGQEWMQKMKGKG